jgi:hypothetical protein
MKIKNGIVSAVAGVSLLVGASAAALLAGSGSGATQPATLLSATVAASTLSQATSATATPTAAPTPTPTATPTPTCDALKDDSGWPVVADGRPAGLDGGDAAADYIWHDGTGWHLRVTHQSDRHQVWSGILTTKGTFSDVDAVKLEKNDYFKVGPDKHTIVFRFYNYGAIDGLDLRTHCAEGIHFALRADGAPVNPTDVIIGHAAHNPPQVPFTIRRKG